MVDFLKSRGNFVDRLLYHLGVSAIMDVLLRLITCIESTECRNDCIKVRLLVSGALYSSVKMLLVVNIIPIMF